MAKLIRKRIIEEIYEEPESELVEDLALDDEENDDEEEEVQATGSARRKAAKSRSR